MLIFINEILLTTKYKANKICCIKQVFIAYLKTLPHLLAATTVVNVEHFMYNSGYTHIFCKNFNVK